MPRNGGDPGAARIEDFIERGFLKIEGAFGAELARRACDRLWAEMRLSPGAPEAWTRPVIRIPFMAGPDFVAAANSPSLHRAYDALVGAGRWLPPRGLGSFPIRFPSPGDPGDAGWHVDVSFGTEDPDFLNWRANVVSRGRALLMLFLFSDVGEEDAPTRLRVGSHAAIARRLLPHGEAGLTLRELAADGFASTAGCEEALATGPAGTVYLCHPFLVHAAQKHRGSRPRFMAQPALLPNSGFDPALPPAPVQVAIRRACGL
ncbi:phytanoyl-CoA dioxygenase family protein [Roseococcus sp. YIM B11640]|uniref:phytanoyl-CoA dioxygenase family protein n=1 Tax=Roseococcus sp. YIM B11640 TaxID=3133973 RepID=UPI003C7C3200